MELRQSTFDPNFWEVISDQTVIQEIHILFPLRSIPRHFDSLDDIFTWLEKTEYKLAKNAALRLLARRSYSKAILFNKLKEKKYSEKQCSKVIEEFESLGYLSDLDYAKNLLEQKIRQGYGPRYIEQYFKLKGLDPKLVKIDARTQKEAIKKWLTKNRGKDPSKQIGALLRKGFSLEIVRSVLIIVSKNISCYWLA